MDLSSDSCRFRAYVLSPQHQKRKKTKKYEKQGKKWLQLAGTQKRKFVKTFHRRRKFGQSNEICASKEKQN